MLLILHWTPLPLTPAVVCFLRMESLKCSAGVGRNTHTVRVSIKHWARCSYWLSSYANTSGGRQREFKVGGTKCQGAWGVGRGCPFPSFFNLEMAYFGEFCGVKFKVCNNIGGYSTWRPPNQNIGGGVSPASPAGLTAVANTTPIPRLSHAHGTRQSLS